MLRTIAALTIAACALGLSACGNNTTDTVPISSYQVSVQNADGAVAASMITSSKIVSGAVSTANGDVFPEQTTNANGGFTLGLLEYSGPIHFQTDSNPAMSAVQTSTAQNVTTSLTISPFTTLVVEAALAGGGLSNANITTVENNVSDWLNGAVNVARTLPLNPAEQDADSAGQARKFYYLLIGGLGRLATDLGITNTQVTAALIADASDGTLDGMDANGAIAGVNANSFTMGLADCVVAFEMESSNVTIDAAAFSAFTSAIQNFNGVLIATP